ncbi:MAG: hypothetical protein PHH85_02055 [Candidatus Methanoperedens sp.]|nr:hypothetical protein [Candidatus Methanoperedens sp.]
MQETKEFSAEVIEGGRVTIPKGIRHELELKKGEWVKMTIQKSTKQRGNIIL